MAIFIRNMPPVRGRIKVRSTILGPVWLTSSALTAVTEGSSISVNLETEYKEPVTYSVIDSGNKPTGWSINSNTGKLTGVAPEVPREGVAYSFTVRAAGAVNGKYTDRTFTLRVNNVNKPPVMITPSNLGQMISARAAPYNFAITSSDPDGAVVRYEVIAGELPEGFTLNAVTGALTGLAPTVVEDQEYRFTIRITDDEGATDFREFTLQAVSPPQWQTLATLASVNEFSNYSYMLSATDRGAVTYSLVSGALPAGANLNGTTGVLSGVAPSVARVGATYSFVIRATNARGVTADRTFLLPVTNVNQPPVFVTGGNLGTVVGGNTTTYSFPITANDPDGTIASIALVSGTLPTGLALANGAITGKLTAPIDVDRVFTFVLRATDDEGAVVTKDFSINAIAGPGWVTDTLNSIREYAQVYQKFEVRFYAGAVTYSVTAGALPAGLTLAPTTGVVSGTPTNIASGTEGFKDVTFTMRGTVPSGAFVEREFTWRVVNVNALPLWNSPTNLGSASADQTNEVVLNLSATDADGSITGYYLESGSLPVGFTLSSAGVFQGKPPVDLDGKSVANFVVSALDNDGGKSLKSFTFTSYPSASYLFSQFNTLESYPSNGSRATVAEMFDEANGVLPQNYAKSVWATASTDCVLATATMGLVDSDNRAAANVFTLEPSLYVNAVSNSQRAINAEMPDNVDGVIPANYAKAVWSPASTDSLLVAASIGTVDDTATPAANVFTLEPTLYVNAVSNPSRTTNAEMPDNVDGAVPATYAKSTWSSASTDNVLMAPATGTVDSDVQPAANVATPEPSLYVNRVSNSSRATQAEIDA